MLLPFSNKLTSTDKFDAEMAIMADRHYSRQNIGSPQFMPPGKTLVIRNPEGTILFGWLQQQFRLDGEFGYNCSIFRNESSRLSSDVILECEELVIQKWGPADMFTYVNPTKIKSHNPGYCFKQAGWLNVRNADGSLKTSPAGLILLRKAING